MPLIVHNCVLRQRAWLCLQRYDKIGKFHHNTKEKKSKAFVQLIFPRKHKRNKVWNTVWITCLKTNQNSCSECAFTFQCWKVKWKGKKSHGTQIQRGRCLPDSSLYNFLDTSMSTLEFMSCWKAFLFFWFSLFYGSLCLSRGWRKAKHWGHHFGVHGSCSHVPLAHAHPLHPQAEEGEAAPLHVRFCHRKSKLLLRIFPRQITHFLWFMNSTFSDSWEVLSFLDVSK